MEKTKRKFYNYWYLLALVLCLSLVLYMHTKLYSTDDAIQLDEINYKENRSKVEQRTNYDPFDNMIEKLMTNIETLSQEIQELKNKEDLISKQLQHNNLTPKHPIVSNLKPINFTKDICPGTYSLIVLCFSTHDKKYRDVIRKTWAKDKLVATSDGDIPFEFRVLFVVFNDDNIKHEALEFNDMIIIDKITSKNSETLKAMLAIYWLDKNCVYDYVLRMTDEMFLNVPKLFSFLHDPKTPKAELYGGFITYNSIMTNNLGFEETRHKFRPMHPRHAQGDTFIMSFDIVLRMTESFDWDHVPADTNAYFGHMVLKTGVDVWNMEEMRPYKYKEKCLQHFDDTDHEHIIILINETDCVRHLYEMNKSILVEI